MDGPAGDRLSRRGIASFPPVLATNAYQRLLYEHLAAYGLELVESDRLRVPWLRRRRASIGFLHFHWPQPYYAFTRGPHLIRPALTGVRLALFAVRLAAARRLGYRITWTVHQVLPHESRTPVLDRLAAVLLSRSAHVLVAHDRTTAAHAEKLLRLAPGRVRIVPHGSYAGEYPPGRSRSALRLELGIAPDAFVFLAFGLLRRYKDVDVLLDAFAAVDDPHATLVIAGRPVDADVGAEVERAAAHDGRIVPLLHFVPDEGVAELYEAADAAVVARGDGGTSGALVLALSQNVPVVAAETETYVELTGDGEAGWLFRAGDARSLATALQLAASDPDAARRKAAAAARLSTQFAWPRIARQLAALMVGTPSSAEPAAEPASAGA